MNQSQIAIRYAKALFDLAVERNVLEKVKSDMALIEKVCNESPELRNMLLNPVISVEKKQKVMNLVFAAHLDTLTSRFIDILARKRREHYIVSIATAFVNLYNEFKGITKAKITTVVALNETERVEILDILKNLTRNEIELTENIRTDLIGGFVLNMENYQLDHSLKTKIKQLKKDFEKNLYVKGF